MLIIRDYFDTFCFRALDVCLGFLLVAFGGSVGLTSGALGGSSVLLGILLTNFRSSWASLSRLLGALGGPLGHP